MQTWTNDSVSTEKRKADSVRSGKGTLMRWISMSDRCRAASSGLEKGIPAAPGIRGTGDDVPEGSWKVEQALIANKHRDVGHM